MAMEIERKFLVRGDAWRQAARDAQRLRQGYLNNEARCSVRVRTGPAQAWLNIKGATVGAERQEFEYEIPLEEAEQMLDSLSLGPLIEKTRYFIDAGPHVWEVDEFEGDNAGLVVAEIELGHADEAFAKPGWLGEEVTDDVRYYNTSLCRHPYKHWRQPADLP